MERSWWGVIWSILGASSSSPFSPFLLAAFSIHYPSWCPYDCPQSTRLETRTKESSMVASLWVIKTYQAKWKQERGKISFSLDDIMHHGGSEVCLCITRSYHTGTRKIANYACIGWSQKKFWWRSEAILTCKSFVKCGYGGERLIEQSSSWFPPKCPPGQLEHMLKNSFIG